MVNEELTIVVKSRDQVVFEGAAAAVSSKNGKGLFDVLPRHGNFITLLDEKLVIRKADGSNQEIPIPDGVLRVVGNKVEVYLGLKLVS